MSKFLTLFLVLSLFGCSTVTPKLTLDAVSIWADSQMLTSSFKSTVPVYELKKDKFTNEEQLIIEDFIFVAEYLVNEFNDMSANHTTLIAISEIDMLWSSAKKAFLKARPILVKKIEDGEFNRRNEMALTRFDTKATELDKSMIALLSEENSDATDIMKEIASILGLTLKIVTIAAAL
jgi:hypothetical protein